MRCENLLAEGHDKVTWKRSRYHSRDKASRQGNTEMWWWRTAATLLGVSFGSYRRHCRDVQMRRRGYVQLRRLGDVPLWHCWVFIWDLFDNPWTVLMGRRYYVPLRHRYDIPMRRREYLPLSHLSDVPLRRRWVFQLKRTCNVPGTCKETSLWRCQDVLLLVGSTLAKKNYNKDPKFKISDIVRISNYKNVSGKGYTRKLFEEVFMIKKVKNTVLWIYVLDGVPNCWKFFGKEL